MQPVGEVPSEDPAFGTTVRCLRMYMFYIYIACNVNAGHIRQTHLYSYVPRQWREQSLIEGTLGSAISTGQ